MLEIKSYFPCFHQTKPSKYTRLTISSHVWLCSKRKPYLVWAYLSASRSFASRQGNIILFHLGDNGFEHHFLITCHKIKKAILSSRLSVPLCANVYSRCKRAEKQSFVSRSQVFLAIANQPEYSRSLKLALINNVLITPSKTDSVRI